LAQARIFFEKAIALDPGNIEAMVGLASVDVWVAASFLTDDWSARVAVADATVSKVLSLAPKHASAHAIRGLVQMFTKRASQGIAECEQALALERNLAVAHAHIGLAKFLVGRAQKPKLTSRRQSASHLGTSWLPSGFLLLALPKRTSMPMPKQSSGCVGASTQTGILPPRISNSRLP
jgi:hypothetical protein